MANTHGTYHLADNPKIYEPMRDNQFEFVVDLGDLVKPGVDAEFATDEGGNISSTWSQEVIRFSVNKVSIPNFKQGVITINRGNTVVKFAGTMTFDTGSIEVIDYIGADAKSVLMAWQRLSGDIKTETVGKAADYKKNATLIEYGPDWEQVRYWDIEGAWVSEVPNDEVSNEGGNAARKITATIVFDKAIMHDPDFEEEDE